MVERLPIIGVMGSHEKEWADLAEPIGRLIAEYDYHLLTGAGPGVMSTVAKAFTEVEERAGRSIGIVPTFEYDGSLVPREQYPNPYIEIPIITPLDKKTVKAANPYSRNYVNVMTSHGLIILPGEQGTRDEVSLGLKFNKPMILFGPDSAFKKFPEQPTRMDDISVVREFLEHVSSRFRTELEERENEHEQH